MLKEILFSLRLTTSSYAWFTSVGWFSDAKVSALCGYITDNLYDSESRVPRSGFGADNIRFIKWYWYWYTNLCVWKITKNPEITKEMTASCLTEVPCLPGWQRPFFFSATSRNHSRNQAPWRLYLRIAVFSSLFYNFSLCVNSALLPWIS